MINVTVEPIGFLRKYREKKDSSMSFEEIDGITAQGLADRIGIPQQYPLLFLINSKNKKGDYVLADGDHVAIMMPIAGG